MRIHQAVHDKLFRKGANFSLGRTATGLCPVAALLNYLVVRGPKAGPLFRYKDGLCLSRQRFVDAVKAALRQAGVEHAKYNGHSFRIEAATKSMAAARGVEDSIINVLGRWRSGHT